MDVIPSCNIKFVKDLLGENKRLDNRNLLQGRSASIYFGAKYGVCLVHLGNTKALARVASELTIPKIQRPAEGSIFINVEISTMASQEFEVGRRSTDIDLAIETGQLLEHCIKTSRAVDLESLCVIEGEKAWKIRVDVTILDHDGSLIDCASIAAVAALSHFKYPEVTVDSTGDVKIHSFDEKYPRNINFHFIPFCVSYAFLETGVVMEPTYLEEKASIGRMVVGANAHRETLRLHSVGSTGLNADKINMYSYKAFERISQLSDDLREAIDKEEILRKAGTSSLDELVFGVKNAKPIFQKPTWDENYMETEENQPEQQQIKEEMEEDNNEEEEEEETMNLGDRTTAWAETKHYEWSSKLIYPNSLPLDSSGGIPEEICKAVSQARTWYQPNW